MEDLQALKLIYTAGGLTRPTEPTRMTSRLVLGRLVLGRMLYPPDNTFTTENQ